MTVKTYENWEGSLNEYLQIGNQVDEEMVDYFINTLPPATLNNTCIQMGEPYGNVNGKATFSTLRNIGNGWEYAGNCHRGEIEEPEHDPDYSAPTIAEIKFLSKPSCLMLTKDGELIDSTFVNKIATMDMNMEDLEEIAKELINKNGIGQYFQDLSEFNNTMEVV